MYAILKFKACDNFMPAVSFCIVVYVWLWEACPTPLLKTHKLHLPNLLLDIHPSWTQWFQNLLWLCAYFISNDVSLQGIIRVQEKVMVQIIRKISAILMLHKNLHHQEAKHLTSFNCYIYFLGSDIRMCCSLITALMAAAPERVYLSEAMLFLWTLYSGNYFFPLLLWRDNRNFRQRNFVRTVIQMYHMVGTVPLCLRHLVLLQNCSRYQLGVLSVEPRLHSHLGEVRFIPALLLLLAYIWKNILSFMPLLDINLFFKMCFWSPARMHIYELRIWASFCIICYNPLVLNSCGTNGAVALSYEFCSVKHRSKLKNRGEECIAENYFWLSFTKYFVLDDLYVCWPKHFRPPLVHYIVFPSSDNWV